MTGIDGGAAAKLQDRAPFMDAPPADLWTAFEAEYFVEWQVADGSFCGGPPAEGEQSSL